MAKGERGYWDFDRAIKQAESAAGNVISATGAIYAVRRSLFGPVPDGVTDDFATSTAVIAQGRRLVFAPDAIAYEAVGGSAEIEYGRKVRVMTRGLNGVVLRRGLLDPRRHGFYAVQLLSHKVLRRLMAVPLLVLAATALRLARRGPFYLAAAAAQSAVYGLGAAGLLLGRQRDLAAPAARAPGILLPREPRLPAGRGERRAPAAGGPLAAQARGVVSAPAASVGPARVGRLPAPRQAPAAVRPRAGRRRPAGRRDRLRQPDADRRWRCCPPPPPSCCGRRRGRSSSRSAST